MELGTYHSGLSSLVDNSWPRSAKCLQVSLPVRLSAYPSASLPAAVCYQYKNNPNSQLTWQKFAVNKWDYLLVFKIICVVMATTASVVTLLVNGQVNWSTVCMFSSLLSGRISTLRDETGAVSIAFLASYLKTRTESAGYMSTILHMIFVLLRRNLLRYKF